MFYFYCFRYMDDIQSAEMRNNNLNNVRSKLESTLDDLEDELAMEKKAKNQVEKAKKKVEGRDCYI